MEHARPSTPIGPVAWLSEKMPPRPLARLLLSFTAAAVFAGLAMFGAWSYAQLWPKIGVGVTTSGPGFPARWYYLSDDEVGLAFILASLLWLLVLWRIWRPIASRRNPLPQILATAGLVAVPFLGVLVVDTVPGARRHVDDEAVGFGLMGAAILAALAIWTQYCRQALPLRRPDMASIRRLVASLLIATGVITASFIVADAFSAEEEMLVGAIAAGGAAGIAWLWLPPLVRAESRAAHLPAELDIRCPTCDYSLKGLRDLRCPECGTAFVLDELILAQRFAGLARADTDSAALR